MARNRSNGMEFAIKFYISKTAFDSEVSLYKDDTCPLGKYLPQVRTQSSLATL